MPARSARPAAAAASSIVGLNIVGGLAVVVSRAGAEIRMLAPSLSPPFGVFQPEPYQRVRINTTTVLRTDVPPAATPLRARAWREECGATTNSSGHCIHVVVVNTLRDSPVAFTLQLLVDQLNAESPRYVDCHAPRMPTDRDLGGALQCGCAALT